MRTGHSPAREIVQLGMPKQQLDCSQVFGSFVDQCRLGSPHRVRAVNRRVEANVRIPVKLDTDSTPNWTRIPEQAGQSERSDAGFLGFTLKLS